MTLIRFFRTGWLLGPLMVIAWAGTSPLAAAQGGLRYSIFVEKFENKSGYRGHELGDEWETLLTSALHENGQFIVVAQGDMQASALKEQVRGMSGITKQGKKTAVRGRMTPAQLLVKGVITHFKQEAADQKGGIGFGGFRVGGGRASTEIRATLQMIDATTGALVASRSFTGSAQKRALSFSGRQGDRDAEMSSKEDDNVHAALEKAIADVIPWMTAQLPSVRWRGSVVKVEKERIFINRGTREGVAAGDEFIAGESEILDDPDTGETLDEIVHERARLRVVQVNERTSICNVISGDIAQLIEGMGIQRGR
ncbi:MAG TPA: CsgG/HfaB family protein [Thermoanaerobaculia bacterium]|nr:CsgG/HfaB family protein [Thermoanaerobaculia bacterium]